MAKISEKAPNGAAIELEGKMESILPVLEAWRAANGVKSPHPVGFAISGSTTPGSGIVNGL